MKIVLLFIHALLVIISCTSPESPEQKAKKAIKENLRLTLNDFKSYEPVQFGKLDSALTKIDELTSYKTLIDSARHYMDAAKLSNTYVENSNNQSLRLVFIENSKEYLAKAKFFMNKAEAAQKLFKPVLKGWKIKHSFRAKDINGNMLTYYFIFIFDPDIDKVIDTNDVTEEILNLTNSPTQ